MVGREKEGNISERRTREKNNGKMMMGEIYMFTDQLKVKREGQRIW